VPPFKPAPLPSLERKYCMDKMICVWISEYVLNTAFIVYKRAGKLEYNYTTDMVRSRKMF